MTSVADAKANFLQLIKDAPSDEDGVDQVLGLLGLDSDKVGDAVVQTVKAAMLMLARAGVNFPDSVDDEVRTKMAFACLIMFGTGFMAGRDSVEMAL